MMCWRKKARQDAERHDSGATDTDMQTCHLSSVETFIRYTMGFVFDTNLLV